MRWILWIVAGLAVLIVIVAVVGAILPKAHVASRTARVAMAPEALYARWSTWLATVMEPRGNPTATADRDGRPAWMRCRRMRPHTSRSRAAVGAGL